MPGMTKPEAPLEKLVHWFTVMAWMGPGVLILGTGIGALMQGAARFVTIFVAVGMGLWLTWVGLRLRTRGKRLLQRHLGNRA
jgi:hypothetical protein